jgi:hypothetical protein
MVGSLECLCEPHFSPWEKIKDPASTKERKKTPDTAQHQAAQPPTPEASSQQWVTNQENLINTSVNREAWSQHPPQDRRKRQKKTKTRRAKTGPNTRIHPSWSTSRVSRAEGEQPKEQNCTAWPAPALSIDTRQARGDRNKRKKTHFRAAIFFGPDLVERVLFSKHTHTHSQPPSPLPSYPPS